MYETKAILRTKWARLQDVLSAEGWEVHKIENGVVFLRRLFGQTAPTTKDDPSLTG